MITRNQQITQKTEILTFADPYNEKSECTARVIALMATGAATDGEGAVRTVSFACTSREPIGEKLEGVRELEHCF